MDAQGEALEVAMAAPKPLRSQTTLRLAAKTPNSNPPNQRSAILPRNLSENKAVAVPAVGSNHRKPGPPTAACV